MNARNLYYPEVNAQLSKTDDYNPVVRVEDGIIQIEITDTRGKKYWCRADVLKSKREANEKLLAYLLNNIWRVAFEDLDISKAELKRRFIKAGLISK